MKILSIETSDKICAVAVSQDNNLIAEKIIEDENTHSVKLMPLLNEVLIESGSNINDIDLFAVDIGPGSFTGIRIGVATIKAFLDIQNKKAVGITSLECLANNIKEEGIICSLINAKNDNAYFGFFRLNNRKYELINDYGFDNINNIINLAQNINSKITFVGSGSIIYRELIEKNVLNATIITNEEQNKVNARNLASIAYIKKEEAVDTQMLKPMYLRKSNAER